MHLIGFLLVFSSLVFCVPHASFSATPQLFKKIAQPDLQAEFALDRSGDFAAKRLRQVGISFARLGSGLAPAQSFTLNLFDDTVFTAVFERTTSLKNGGFAWIGHLDGVPLSQVVLIVSEDRLTGTVSMPGASYSIRKQENTHLITEDDHSLYPNELPPIISPSIQNDNAPQAKIIEGDDSCSDISVLVAYTPEARAAAGGVAAIEDRINLAIVETNQSYINSGINQQITLASTIETAPGDAANEFYTDLYALQNLTDGIFDNVDFYRQVYSADLVALIIENSSSCGLGFLNSTENYAFSVTHRTCATGYYSFGHELGHNMGARHDWYVDDAYSYGKAYVNLPDKWRTVMGYNDMCNDNSVYCNRIQYWSNPDKLYLGDAMGVSTAGPYNCVEGGLNPGCAADNRTMLNSTCSTVANFRQSPSKETGNFPWLLFLPPLISR